ncbi:dTDP-4-dehydrorhamnose 3,5-epimerase [Hoeflea sp.]|uniref:dTDP-4-dehydrorhamnose 3,5-epimerase family protein n=1 Tax=Hoeflea sp. TaxID=1940281 RepID=UPI002AFF2906|nr:dTDP-4-dehydrorhamnose 3,5-epimerase [Hoeflea sp.]
MSTTPFTMTELMPGTAGGPMLVARSPRVDDRGAFARIFCAEALSAVGWPGPVAQINHSQTRKAGTLRGLHFQRAPHAEAKLVICIRGSVFDVAVDIRENSPTRYQHAAAELSAEAGTALYLPEGFAHGFQALSDDAELIYVHSAAYAPDHESGLRADDPVLAIAWPLPVTGISERDGSHPLLDTAREEP